MEWLIAIPVALMFALCAFMMLSMMVRDGWEAVATAATG